MVLADLASRITNAFSKLTKQSVIDDEAVNVLLKEVSNALIVADVDIKLVINLNQKIKKRIVSETSEGVNKANIIKKAVFAEVCELLDSGVDTYQFNRGKVHVILFVGLQGSGKTTTVCKFGHYFKRRGWRPAAICADTFRAGALDQLMQNAAAAGINFYGDRSEQDPVKLARDGLQRICSTQKNNMILIDTSGRSRSDSALFNEMKEIALEINPDLVVFVMDGSVGQSAFDQAKAFKNAIDVGAIIITKLDGKSKGGGIISAVAAAQSPVMFIGTGESMVDLIAFEPRSFVSKLFGWGDTKGLADMLVTRLSEQQVTSKNANLPAKFTLRDMHQQFLQLMKIGSVTEILRSIPGLKSMGINLDIIQDSDLSMCAKKATVTMDSMTTAELDEPKIIDAQRISRISLGSGTSIIHVEKILSLHQRYSVALKKNPIFNQIIQAQEGLHSKDSLKAQEKQIRSGISDMIRNIAEPNRHRRRR